MNSGLGERKESLSQAELERQQVIAETKKKTQLSSDNSWIRQQNTSNNTSKEPFSLSMKRSVHIASTQDGQFVAKIG